LLRFFVPLRFDVHIAGSPLRVLSLTMPERVVSLVRFIASHAVEFVAESWRVGRSDFRFRA